MFFLQMSGFPGSGKSTLSREIARRLDAVIVDYDVPKTALLESTSQHPLMHTLTIDMNRPFEAYLSEVIAISKRLIDHLMHPLTFSWMYFFNRICIFMLYN